MQQIAGEKCGLADIVESGTAIQGYIEGYSFQDFSGDRKTYSAVIREFEIIGEAVGKLPEKIKNQRAEVEWQDIKDFRNLFIHEYFGVDLEIIWQVIQNDLPQLLETAKELSK